MSLSRHVYSGELWATVSDKVARLGCEAPETGDTQETWLIKVDRALDRALELQNRLLLRPEMEVKPPTAFDDKSLSKDTRELLRPGLRELPQKGKR